MEMTDKQFNSYMRFVLEVVLKALKKMPDCEEKNDLQKMADNIQKTVED